LWRSIRDDFAAMAHRVVLTLASVLLAHVCLANSVGVDGINRASAELGASVAGLFSSWLLLTLRCVVFLYALFIAVNVKPF
jgi:hypothetical protein